MKKILPLSARKNIFHSFVQSHLNYCSLVWGLGAKSSIEPLFNEQKKAIRTLMPGYNCNYYKNGLAPCHTKQFFKEHAILSIHSLILTKVLLFMHKIHNFGQGLPSAVINTISADAPKYGNTNELCTEWFANHSTQKMRNALFFKGPLFYLKYFPEILQNRNHNINISFKAGVRSFVFDIQSEGRPNTLEGLNMPLYYCPGLPRINREGIDYNINYNYED